MVAVVDLGSLGSCLVAGEGLRPSLEEEETPGRDAGAEEHSEKVVVKPRRELSPETNLPAPSSWTACFQNSEKTQFCCLCYPMWLPPVTAAHKTGGICGYSHFMDETEAAIKEQTPGEAQGLGILPSWGLKYGFNRMQARDPFTKRIDK